MKKLNLILLSTLTILLIFSSCKKEEITVVKEELTQEKALDLINGPQTAEDLERLDEYYGLTDTKLTREELEQRLGIDNSDKTPSQSDGSFRCACNMGTIDLSAAKNGFIIRSFSSNANDDLVAVVTPIPSGSPQLGWISLSPNCNTSFIVYLQQHLNITGIAPGQPYKIDFYLAGSCSAHAYRYFIGE